MSFGNELVAHLVIVGFATYVILSADPWSGSLFSFHPTCCVLAWALFMEGVLLFRRPSPGWRVALHWFLEATALTLLLIGFFCIYQNKENSGKPHFTSYHSLVGIFTVVLCCIQAAGGNIANFSLPISKKFPIVKPKLIKWGHRISGAFSLSGLNLTLFLALFSFWFTAVTNDTLTWWTVAVILPFPLTHVLKSTYS